MMPKFMSAGWLGGPRGPEKRHDEINSTLNIQQKYTEKKPPGNKNIFTPLGFWENHRLKKVMTLMGYLSSQDGLSNTSFFKAVTFGFDSPKWNFTYFSPAGEGHL